MSLYFEIILDLQRSFMEGIELPPPLPPHHPAHSQIIYETREMNISTHWKLKLQSVFRFPVFL